jgi:phage FluMu gp28-like protein
LYPAADSPHDGAPPLFPCYFLGGDIGREKHLTVFWISELLGDVLITRKVIRLRKTPYDTQLTVASDLLSNFNILRGCIDATGIGDMLVESLQKRFGTYRIEKVKFTAPVKEHLASLVRGRMEDKRCRIPADRQTRESFHSVRKTVTATGNIRFDAATTEAGHADDFWAFALSCEAAYKPQEKPSIISLNTPPAVEEYVLNG